MQAHVDGTGAAAFLHGVSWRARLAQVLFARPAARAIAAARADLEAVSLPEAVARRTAIPLARRRQGLRVRGIASAVNGRLAGQGETHPCLVASLALLGEARRAGYAPSLVVGVRQDERGAASHAWLELDGVPFLEATHLVASYAPIAVLPEGRHGEG